MFRSNYQVLYWTKHDFIAYLEPPKERPRLQLLPKRTDKTESREESESTNKASSAASSIFGGAKPVDTAKKDAEIEKNLQVIEANIFGVGV